MNQNFDYPSTKNKKSQPHIVDKKGMPRKKNTQRRMPRKKKSLEYSYKKINYFPIYTSCPTLKKKYAKSKSLFNRES